MHGLIVSSNNIEKFPSLNRILFNSINTILSSGMQRIVFIGNPYFGDSMFKMWALLHDLLPNKLLNITL
jgi:hypothetical protein